MNVHYQEKTSAGYVTNTMWNLAEITSSFSNDELIECLLNSVGEWEENGELNGEPLLIRFKGIVCDINLEEYEKNEMDWERVKVEVII